MFKKSLPTLILLLLCMSGPAYPQDPRPARLAGVFWFLSPTEIDYSPEAWRTELDAMSGLGMRVMVLAGAYLGESEKAPDPMEAFFAEADRRGLELYLDTGSVANWWTLPDPAPEVARAKASVDMLQQKFGGHASFKGFYIPYELYVFWDAKANLVRTLYGDISAACKAAAPDKKVMISPFFILDKDAYLGDFRYATPDEYRDFWTGILKGTDIDIVAMQDSGEHLSCYTMEDRAPFFAAMKAACDAAGKTFWANIETGELEVASLDDYVKRFGLKTHVNDQKTAAAWRGVPADKMAAKLSFCGKYTDTAITWGYKEFVRPSKDPKLYEAYVTTLKKMAKTA